MSNFYCLIKRLSLIAWLFGACACNYSFAQSFWDWNYRPPSLTYCPPVLSMLQFCSVLTCYFFWSVDGCPLSVLLAWSFAWKSSLLLLSELTQFHVYVSWHGQLGLAVWCVGWWTKLRSATIFDNLLLTGGFLIRLRFAVNKLTPNFIHKTVV